VSAAPGVAPGKGWWTAALLIAAATLAAHGWSLGDGLALDDHWHYHSIHQRPFEFSDLLHATTIDVKQQVGLWWQERDVRFVYARPVAVALLKASYALSGGSPVAAHAVSLVLHFLAGLLVYALCRLLTQRRGMALFGGLVFVIYPHTVYAAGWLAAQNIVLQTGLMLAALLVYVRASGLVLGPGGVEAQAASPAVPALRVGVFAVVILLWVLALGARENALMLPGILVAFDLAYGGRRQVLARWPAYLVFAVLGIAFLYWRLVGFYEPMPEVYVRRSDSGSYGLWLIAKLIHYLNSAVLPVPMTIGPSGRYDPFREIPVDMGVMTGLLVLVVAIYVWAARRERGYWIWPLWVVLAILPVLQVLATPHSGYLCGAGVAVGMAVALAALGRRPGRGWRRFATVAAVCVLLSHSVSMKVGRLLWKGMVYAEQFTTRAMIDAPPPESAERVFCINMPFAAIYAKRCVAEQIGPRIDALPFDVLTFAPDLLRMDAACMLVQTDDHAFTVELEDARYFSGLLGRFLIAGFRKPCRFEAGDRFVADGYTVEILEADAGGVRKIGFRFERPLHDPAHCFYIASDECGAVRLTFAKGSPPQPLPQPPATAIDVHKAATAVIEGHAEAAGTVFAGLRSTEPAIRETAAEVVDEHIRDVARALAAPMPQLLAQPDTLANSAEALWAWWQAEVDAEELVQIQHNRLHLRRIRHRRDEIKRARERMGYILHSDLVLTGKPYPSLRPNEPGCDR